MTVKYLLIAGNLLMSAAAPAIAQDARPAAAADAPMAVDHAINTKGAGAQDRTFADYKPADEAKTTAKMAAAAFPAASTIHVQCVPGQQNTANISTGTAQYFANPPVGVSQIATVITTGLPGPWIAPFGGAQWVQAINSATAQPHPSGSYYYRIKIVVAPPVPNGTPPTPCKIAVRGEAAGDDAWRAVWLTGNAATGPVVGDSGGWVGGNPTVGFGFNPAKPFFGSFATTGGTYYLRFRVDNGPSGSPHGLFVKGILTIN